MKKFIKKLRNSKLLSKASTVFTWIWLIALFGFFGPSLLDIEVDMQFFLYFFGIGVTTFVLASMLGFSRKLLKAPKWRPPLGLTGLRTIILGLFFMIFPVGILALRQNYPSQNNQTASVELQSTELLTPNPTPTSEQQPTAPTSLTELPTVSGSEVFSLVNTYRAQNGLEFWTVSDELCRLAESRANYFMEQDMKWFKNSQTGEHSGFQDVAGEYSGQGVGENLAANVVSAEQAVELWKASPPHDSLMQAQVWDDVYLDKACVATRVSEVGSIVVLLVGDE